MIIGWRRLSTISAMTAVLLAYGCDSGSPSKTRDDIAADSALASDLALANRDTLLVDSIGEYRPPDAAESDTAGANLVTSAPQPVLTVPSPEQPKVNVAAAPPPPGKKTEVVTPPVTVSPPPKPISAAPVTP